SLGIAVDYQLATARRARVVIAEVNSHAPLSPSALVPNDVRIDHVVWTDDPIVQAPKAANNVTVERIAQHVAGLVPDKATLSMGIGSIMEAVCRALSSHRNLGIHTGILGDGMADLIIGGAVTNAHKGSYVGKSVAGSLFGSQRLFDFAHRNSGLCLVET